MAEIIWAPRALDDLDEDGCVWIVAIHHSARLLTGDDLP